MSALIFLENGHILGELLGELPREGDVIQIVGHDRLFKVTTVIWVFQSQPSTPVYLLQQAKRTRIIVEDMDIDDGNPYLNKVLQRMDVNDV